MNDFNYGQLSPNIREVVRWLRSMGYETTDSGDGTNHAAGMECAIPEPMVTCQIDYSEELVEQASGLYHACLALELPETVRVEASYSPNDGVALLLLIGLDDTLLAKHRCPCCADKSNVDCVCSEECPNS